LSAELKSGTAHISGILKGFSSEELKGDTISIMVSVNNNFGREYLNYYGKVDSLGYFSLDVPLLGTQELLISPIAGERRYMYNYCILQPGDSIFMLKEKFYIPMAMGKSARLQNEINSFDRNTIPETGTMRKMEPSREEAISYKNECIDKYNKHLDKRRAFLEQHPTFSQQFRDYDSITSVFRTAEHIISMIYETPTKAVPAECAESVMKLIDINASLPLNLITEIRSTIECINRNKAFQGPMKEYFLNTPSALHDLLISGIAKLSVEDSTKIVQFINDPKSVSKTEVERIFEDYGMMGIETECRLYHIYDEPFYESICTTDNLLDLHLSNQVSMQLEGSHQPLDEYSLSMANKIKLNSVRERLLKRHEYYKDVLKGKEEAVNAVIHPSTDVEGLTDGKAILDKLVAPYKGKIVYLDIWGTWCGPCKNKLKESHKLKAELKNYDIVYLYLANNSPEDSWKNVIGEYNLTEPNCVHYNLPPKQQRAIEQYVKITGYPTYRLIDRKGGLHHLKWTDDEDLPKFKKTLDELP
jgi:thiol-disulfide isomerase/thioredoxin